MTDIIRTGWLQPFIERRSPNMALSRLFSLKRGNIFSGCKASIDIQRFDEDVAIAIKKCTGPNLNDVTTFTNKEFELPAYSEAIPTDACELLNRRVGVDPYSAAYMDYSEEILPILTRDFSLLSDKITRGIELQASQVLQTGVITLVNEDGDTVYEIDFKPKASHFPVTQTSWGSIGETPLEDIENLSDVIRADGKVDPDNIIMGKNALRHFLDNAEVKDRLDNRRISVGEIMPMFENSGMTLYGTIWIGCYSYNIWCYNDTYKDPQTGDATKYIDDDKVVIFSSQTRFDMLSGLVPVLNRDPRFEDLIPDSLLSLDNQDRTNSSQFAMTPTAYFSVDGEQMMTKLQSYTLLAPIQVDGYGCLTAVVAP